MATLVSPHSAEKAVSLVTLKVKEYCSQGIQASKLLLCSWMLTFCQEPAALASVF